MTAQLNASDCLGRHWLILGDVNTGKTTLCRRLLADLCELGLGARCGVLDLAPHIPAALARQHGLAGVGGALRAPPGCGVREWRARLAAPRLSSSTEAQAADKAERNARIIERQLAELRGSGRDILFINDATLYLQAGSLAHLLQALQDAAIGTVVANAYRGQRLGGGALTQREQAQTEAWRQQVERQGRVITLTQRYG